MSPTEPSLKDLAHTKRIDNEVNIQKQFPNFPVNNIDSLSVLIVED